MSNINIFYTMHQQRKQLNILSLDGGGIRGLSSLHMLKYMMQAIDPRQPPRPCEVFDVIGGVGSGGLIAIMLGRLKMDVEQCINAYQNLLECSFQQRSLHLRHGKSEPQRSLHLGHAKFDPQRCASELRSILVQSGYEENALFGESEPSCRVVIYLTDWKTQKSFPLTSYESKRCPSELSMTATIVQAGQACLASLAGYKPVTIGPDGKKYCDSSRNIVNPVRQVWAEANGLWPGVLASQLGCVVSIGAGTASIKGKGMHEEMGLERMLSQLDVHDPEKEANAFLQTHTELDDAGRLYRFNVPDGLGDIKVDEMKQMELVVEVTNDFLTTELVRKQMRRCVSACVC
ncbi:uncharacterized protein NFIA_059710 [Aspergillus fischeri NRRL 181]|uniref:Phospholipase, patatin family protein n=1 Tax=Neosartorya fischeri (strain ATCC 1020 / DSM 3700 / CBS 544.65 / FGSC A1164 / JCM 1740 / NRRL 181 / WB 181) TaxID=331117 RepID=A1DP95_NEOFI|nr:phospholipase, patatin family protein [Aspergillus fischeri NRRL 181]EAW16616.1 phospholipase, patatin family protein [Aspergillus fischeri NRRL 181]